MIYADNLFVCLAIPLLTALAFIRGSARRLCGFLIAGMLVCLLSAYIDGFLSALIGFSVDDTAIFLAPVTEEFMKLMPLLFYVLVADPTDNALLSAAIMVGAGFATFENACYLLSVGTSNLAFILERGLAVGVMHVVCALAVGFGLSLIRRFRSPEAIGALGVFAFTVTYHAVYNLLASVPGAPQIISDALPLFSAGVFFLFRKRRNPQRTGSGTAASEKGSA